MDTPTGSPVLIVAKLYNHQTKGNTMKVQELIDNLKEHKPDEEIIIAYWTREWFADILDRDINDEQWEEIIQSGNHQLECTNIGEYFIDLANEVLPLQEE